MYEVTDDKNQQRHTDVYDATASLRRHTRLNGCFECVTLLGL